MISSYRGSQLFEIVGLSDEVVAKCFTNTDSRIGGKTFKNLEQESKSIDLFARSNIILMLLNPFKKQLKLVIRINTTTM